MAWWQRSEAPVTQTTAEDSGWQYEESEVWLAVDEAALVDGNGKKRDRGHWQEEIIRHSSELS